MQEIPNMIITKNDSSTGRHFSALKFTTFAILSAIFGYVVPLLLGTVFWGSLLIVVPSVFVLEIILALLIRGKKDISLGLLIGAIVAVLYWVYFVMQNTVIA